MTILKVALLLSIGLVGSVGAAHAELAGREQVRAISSLPRADWALEIRANTKPFEDHALSELIEMVPLSTEIGQRPSLEAEFLLEVAICLNKPGLAKLLYTKQPSLQDPYFGRLVLADWQLEKRAELDEAYDTYAELGGRLYQPARCHYRMAEICCLRGQLEQALQHLSQAKSYELES
jgi:hypothetical protein